MPKSSAAIDCNEARSLYGAYLDNQNRVTLFDRQYAPLYTWSPDEGVSVADPRKAIDHSVQIWFCDCWGCNRPEHIDKPLRGVLKIWAHAAAEGDKYAECPRLPPIFHSQQGQSLPSVALAAKLKSYPKHYRRNHATFSQNEAVS